MNNEELLSTIESIALEIKEHKKIQLSQKQRGVNDFNIFTIIRNVSEEEGLHSRFLHHLLDPQGNHGQGDLFLKEFLKIIKIKGVDTSNITMLREYKFIDLYMTDGNKHIIIENKIYAADQDKQIERYIDTITKHHNALDNLNNFYSNLTIIYLTLDKHDPKPLSLGRFKIEDSKLVYEDDKLDYQKIQYSHEITEWLNNCLKQVSNITNLSVGLQQYQSVIQKLYKTNQENLMSFSSFLDSKNNKMEIAQKMAFIHKQFPALQKEIMDDFFNIVVKKLEELIGTKKSGWVVELKDNSSLSKRYGSPLRIKHKNYEDIFYGFEFNFDNYTSPLFGIVRKDESISLDLLKMDTETTGIFKHLAFNKYKSSQWWLCWGWYSETQKFTKPGNYNLFDVILESDLDTEATNLANAFFNLFDVCEIQNEVIKTYRDQ